MSLRLRLGWRREVVILLPAATLVLVLLSTFTLFAFRSAVQLLTEGRRAEAAQLAERAAAILAAEPPPSSLRLRQLAPGARGVAVIDARGELLASAGRTEGVDGLAPLTDRRPERAVGLGPDEALPGTVAGFARFTSRGRDHFLRVDLAAEQLDRQARSVAVLTWVVLPVNVALTGLLLLFLRHVLSPFDALIEQVRELGPTTEEEDDISHLVETVRRALARLSPAAAPHPDDDVQALQRVLGPGLASGVMLLDRHGEALTLNPAGAQLLTGADTPGPSPQAALARHPAFAGAVAAAVRDPTGAARREIDIETPSGHRTLGLTVHPLQRDDGTARAHLALFVDLTESRRRAEEERLAASLEQLGALTAGVAHEMRNGLATLKGYLALVERRPEEESIADYLSEMRRESDHLQRVLDDFLSFARPETTRSEEVDLLRIVRRAAADPALAGQPVEIRPSGEGAALIRADPQLLERAVRNLLHNALEAQREIGETAPLEVLVRAGGEEVEVEIGDRGPGIPADLEERLFQPFVSGRAGGVGLGLALARRIVTLHGGRLRLENRPRGGARAVLRLPGSRRPADEPADEPAGNPG